MEDQTAVIGEENSAPSASEIETAPEAEISEADTLDQPAEEATGDEPKPSRAQSRISELAQEKNYWKDLALQNAPLKETPAPEQSEDGTIGLEDIANAVVGKLEEKARLSKAELAQKTMFEDAQSAISEFPELDTDERLSKRVIAIAQVEGISLTEAARDYIGTIKAGTRKSAEQSVRSGVTSPAPRAASTGQAPDIDLSSASEDEKAANWDKYISKLSQSE